MVWPGGVRAVFFDVGNTLLYPSPSVSHVVEEILRSAGHDRDLEAIEELMPLVDAYYEDRFRADDTFWTSEEATSEVWVGMYSLLCRTLGIDDEAEALARAVYREFGRPDRWRAYPDVAPALERLRARGVLTGIISNWDTRHEGILEGLGLGTLLDTIVCSSAVGLHKPDPRIFELACERLGVKPSETAHIGDHVYSDILGARAAGMHAVLISRHSAPAPMSVKMIESLDDLEGALA
jgi:putative hydrolase of the HAD superfamily